MKAIDFFCGAGGVTSGFIQAEINVLGGIDNDMSCKDTYEKNNGTKFLHADIRELKKNSLSNEFGISKNDNELIFIGCSPCQYYTNLKTDKSKSHEGRMLLEDFHEFVKYYKPGYVFIENVPGFEKNGKSPIAKFKKSLSHLGYDLDDDVLNAKNYGVPQNRRRYILLATRLKNGLTLPSPIYEDFKTVLDVIGNKQDFPPIEAGHLDESFHKHSAAGLSKLNLERIKKTKRDGGSRMSWPEELQPACYKNHHGHYDVYGRMFWKKSSPTITTRFNSYSNGRYGHPEQDRAISLREGAALQSFPIDYKFYSTNQAEIAKMIGNAVPPELARRIGKKILKVHNGKI